MNRPRALSLLPLLALAALACGEPTSPSPQADDLEAPAAELLGLLSEGRYLDIAARMHYPAIYTPEQLNEDRAGVNESLAVLMNETGGISRYRVATDRGPFLQVSVVGGNDSYWKAHPAGRGGTSVLFDVEFAKIGAGVVQIAFLESEGEREVRSVGIGVKGSRPDARNTMERIMRSLTGEPEYPTADTAAAN